MEVCFKKFGNISILKSPLFGGFQTWEMTKSGDFEMEIFPNFLKQTSTFSLLKLIFILLNYKKKLKKLVHATLKGSKIKKLFMVFAVFSVFFVASEHSTEKR